jgi:hypothetical protein
MYMSEQILDSMLQLVEMGQAKVKGQPVSK